MIDRPQLRERPSSTARRPVEVELMRILDEKHAWTSIAYEAAHVGAVFVVDSAPLLNADGGLNRPLILERIDAALGRLPDLTKKMITSPLGLTAPAWVPDEDYDVARHVAFAEGIHEFGKHSLVTLAGLDDQPLPTDRPLWGFTITRLTSGDIALGVRLHHVMGDAKWLFETLTLITDESDVVDAPRPVHARDVARAPRTRWSIPPRAGISWLAEQTSLRAGWHEYWRKPFMRRVRRMGGRNIRFAKEWSIRRRNLAAQYLPATTCTFLSVPLDEATATASAHGGSINDLIVAATSRAVDDDDRGIDLWVPVSRREKGDRVVRNHVRMARVHIEPGAGLAETVKTVRTQIRRFVVGIDDAPAVEGRAIGYATYVPWSTTRRYLLGTAIKTFLAVPATDRRDELNTFALSYDGTVTVTVSGRAELDTDGAARRVSESLAAELAPVGGESA